VPTVEEAAGLPGFEVRNWYGLLAPKGVPAPVLARLGAVLRAALTDAEVVAALDRQGLEATPSTAEEFTAQILAERAKWAPIVRAAGVTTE
jgi:tripartite-type tricarboxylate transporter receptor subunit TctC